MEETRCKMVILDFSALKHRALVASKAPRGRYDFKGVLHPRPVFGLFLHFSQKLQHIGNK